jgi:autotransporter-associated beta strand protein
LDKLPDHLHFPALKTLPCLMRFFLLAALALPLFAAPVINEIHYRPAKDPTLGALPLEFVELLNPGGSVIDLSNWKLTEGVSYTFPPGTQLGPGAYLVIAENPAALTARYGVNALGPFSGKLSNTGETLELRDSANTRVDSVSYRPGFPWPTGAHGAGPSMELLHPTLDNDLGGSWRSSGTAGTPAATYVSASATGWNYKKGTAEASSPVDDWRNLNHDMSSGWLSGQTPIGYGTTVPCNTVLSDMQGTTDSNYSTVYARKFFTIASDQLPDTLTLRVRFDDGCIVWINGTEVFRRNMPAGQVPYNGLATATVGTAAWTTVNLSSTSAYLLRGSNVIAIHGANITKGGSGDFSIDAELLAPATGSSSTPTPGAPNAARLAQNAVPPQIRQVNHAPRQPTAGVPVTVTARITDPDGVGPVNLLYQAVEPGNYIRISDPSYQTSWTTIPMTDDGINGDAVAGDSNFTAVLPASLQTNRRLIRYRIHFADSLGNSQTVPYADDEQPNFAYFVYNGVPAWTGAFRPTSYELNPPTPPVTYPPETIGSIHTYHLIAHATDVTNSQYTSTFNNIPFSGSLVYDGIVYDHIQFKNRGLGSTYVSGKNKWNLFFNRCRDFQPRDNWGNKYAATWNNLILNANASPWAPINRGSAGIEEAASARIFELAGNTNFRTHYVHLRVIDDAVETSPTDQFSGDLWGLYLAIEPTEGNFLTERNLPDGNIYAIEGNNGDKKHQGDGQPVDSSDWNTFRTGLAASGQTEAWYRHNIDLPRLYTFLAINRLIGNVDVRPGDNYRYYHRSSDDRWEILGYDFDMQFIAAHHWGGSMDSVVVAGQPNSIRAIMRHPALAREYRNRCRELLDLLASDGSASGGQIGQLLHEYAAMVHPPGETLTWANLDAAMWNLHPRTATNHKGKFLLANMTDSRGGLGGTVKTDSWIRTLADPDGDKFADFPARIQWFIDYATNTYPTGATAWRRKATSTAGGGNDPDVNRQKGFGYKYLEWESLHGGYANANVEPTSQPHTDLPNKPTLAATGDPTFPVNNLSFTPSAFSDPQGAGTFAAWQWRIAEISSTAGEPGKYEIQTLASSGEITTPPAAFSVPAGIAQPGKTYRVRVRQKDTTGNWSHWSAPVQFAATPAPAVLLHYWNFNQANDILAPTSSIGGGGITPELSGNAELISHASTDQGFTGLNARNDDAVGSHLRVNNPLGATLQLAIPSTGFENILVKFETRRSTQGAGIQNISYTVDGTQYLPFESLAIADAAPEVKTLDFRTIPGADNNPLFSVRIAFAQGGGGLAGNNRFDNLTVEASPLPGSAILLPGGDAEWNLASNWSGATVPDGPGATAIIGAPTSANRSVTLSSPITLESLDFQNGESPFRNRINGAALGFNGGNSSALLKVTGSGSGFSELDLSGGTLLSTQLRLHVSNIEGDPVHGVLRLRETWSGPGGLTKEGPGLVSLSGGNKNFTGPVLIGQGVLQVTQAAVPGQSSGTTVLPGGQLRLVSGSDAGSPRIHTFGGSLTLAGKGRGTDVPNGEEYGVLGALRFDPAPSGSNGAIVTNPVVLSGDAGIHTDGPDNTLELSNEITGPGSLEKSGGGALVLSGNSPSFSGPVKILNGPLEVNGDLTASSIQLDPNSLLRGSGITGPISGSGTVAPHLTTLTAPSCAAVHFRFVMEKQTCSVLRLTHAQPFPNGIDTVDLFIDRSTLNTGDRLIGGFLTEPNHSLAATLANAQVRILIRDADGEITHRDLAYRPAVPADQVSWSATNQTLEILIGGSPQTFSQWQGLHFATPALSGPTDDPSGSGVPNLLRYALGVGPHEAANALLPAIVRNHEGHDFLFFYDPAKTDLIWRVTASQTLAEWTQVLFDSRSSPLPPLQNGRLAVPLPAENPALFSRLEVLLDSL